jgi:membrane associated rhomboid family serine protease
MLSDRPYMRGDYVREKTSVLTWLISALVAGFVVQLIVGSEWLGGNDRVSEFLALQIGTLREGWAWTLLTHGFLHSTTFIVHVIFNVLALYFLGRELLPMLGTKRFLGVFTAATIVGGLAWSAVHWSHGAASAHIGASAAVDALFIIFACFFPNQQITFLLFFVFPVTLKPKHVAGVLVGLSLFSLIAYEIPNTALPFGIALASSAHLGGMLTGYLYYRFVHDSRWTFGSPDRPEVELPRWLKRAKKPVAQRPAFEVNTEPTPPARDRENIRAEVDRILDKINAHGFGALTPDEKRVLDDAKDLLSRR